MSDDSLKEDLVGGGKAFDEETMEADQYSRWIAMCGADSLAAYLYTSGGTTHAGTIYLQLSMDKSHVANHATNITVSAGAALAADQTWTSISHPYARLFFDRTSGVVTELLTALVHVPKRG